MGDRFQEFISCQGSRREESYLLRADCVYSQIASKNSGQGTMSQAESRGFNCP
jgi:hypothetical protein